MPHLLDTDSASLAFNGNAHIRRRIQQTPDLWLSSIAAEESSHGALSLIQKDRDRPGMPAAHDFLVRILADISSYQIHSYNAEAALILRRFPPQSSV